MGAYVLSSGVRYVLSTPYAVADLPFLKVTQSGDVMSLCCINQNTGTEYPPYDLARVAANNWTLTEVTFGADIAAPTNCVAEATTGLGSSEPTAYAYVITAISQSGEESVASNIGNVTNSPDIALFAGSISITWSAVTGAAYYNVYKAPAS